LSWTHFTELLPVKSQEARLYYANDAFARGYGTKELRRQISRKAYERREIAGVELPEKFTTPFNVFRDPYLLDMFGLKDNFDEAFRKSSFGRYTSLYFGIRSWFRFC
jgi:predicted nuclease of restriction endonuclease-like (RecB) superfamily